MTELPRSKFSLKLTLINSLLWLIARLSFMTARRWGAFFGRLSYYLNSRSVKVSAKNIALCLPELSSEQQKKLLKQSCIHSGMVFFESCWVWQASNQDVAKLIVSVTGQEYLDKAIAKGKGVILTGPHLGNWEALLAWGGMNLKASCMYRRPKITELDPLIQQARSKSGVELIIGERSSVRQMLTTLKQGECFLLLSDQNPAANAGVFAPFFHHPAYTMVLIQRLIAKTKSELLFFHAERVENGFKVHIKPANFSTADQSTEQFAELLNQQLAQQIKSCPEQFEWSYRRFRPVPEGYSHVYLDL